MSNYRSPFAAGHLAGEAADDAMDAFAMSAFLRDYVIGYIVGYSSMQSFLMASHSVAAWSAAELANRYGIAVQELLPYLGFDEELTREFFQAYASERENDEVFDFD